jgi:anaerobic ribonucleoside-triphosphate reductase activating protein
MKIYIAGIVYGSMLDGLGLRTAIFFSGCTVKCEGCHNKEFWNIAEGKEFFIDDLVNEIKNKTPQKKITITGGEPLEQKEALIKLIDNLDGFDIGLYTSYSIDSIEESILKKLRFIKTGKFEVSKKINHSFYGSSNQNLYFLK